MSNRDSIIQALWAVLLFGLYALVLVLFLSF